MAARIIRSDHIWPCSSDDVCGRMGRATSLPRIFTDRTLRCLVDIACSGTGRGDGRDQPEKHVRQSPWGAGLGRRRTSGLGDPSTGRGRSKLMREAAGGSRCQAGSRRPVRQTSVCGPLRELSDSSCCGGSGGDEGSMVAIRGPEI